MEDKFQEIKKEYDDFDKALMRHGRLPMKDTGIGFWNASPSKEIFELFKKIGLQNYKHFLDLGSGDGRIVLIASLFTKATGIELDQELINKAVEIKHRLKKDNAEFLHKNYFEHDISEHDIIFLAPDKPMYRGAEEKLLNELNGELIVFGHHFHPTMLRKKAEFDINGDYAAVYTK